MAKPQWGIRANARQAGYATRLFLSSMVVLLLALSSGLITYSFAARQLRNETVRLNDIMLKETAAGFDERIASASVFVTNVACDPQVLQAVIKDRHDGSLDVVQIYRAYQSLVSLYQEKFTDLFVYFSHSDRIISGIRASSARAVYAKAYRLENALTREALGRLLQHAANAYVFCLDGSPAVAVAQALPLNRLKDPNAVVVCVLNESDTASIKTRFQASDGFFMVLGADGRAVFCTQDNSLAENVRLVPPSDELSTVNIAQRDYLIQAYTSPQTGLTYLHALPVSLFWERLESLRYMSFFTFLLFFALGMVAIYILTKQNYKPIGSLVCDVTATIQAKPEQASGNEIAYLRHVLLSTLEERRRNSRALRESFVERALCGLYDQDCDLRGEFGAYGVTLLSDRFTVFSILLEERASAMPANRTHVDEAIRLAFDESVRCAGIPFCGILICHRAELYSYLLNLPPEMKPDTAFLVPSFQERLQRRHAMVCTVSCGECMPGWEGLVLSYARSTELLKQRSLYGPGCFIPSDSGGSPPFRYSFAARERTELSMLAYIRTGTPEPGSILRQIKEDCCEGQIRLTSEFQCYAHDLCALMQRIARQAGCAEECLEPLYACDNLPEFDSCFIRLMDELRGACAGLQVDWENENEEALCRDVMAYIEENLAHASLCPEKVGLHFGLTGPYLSKRFKRLTGVSLAEQISSARVERAKRLLIETEDSLEKLSSSLGFLDSSAFIRVFKKSTGLTPGLYRRLYQK